MLFDGILKSVFGDKGLTGGVMDVLEKTGIVTSPEQKLAAQKALQDYELAVGQQELDSIKEVNATMREEAKSEHWLQWSWRPLVGYCFIAVIVNNYILMPYLAKWIQPITVPADVWMNMMVVLGVAAGTRGVKQIFNAKKQ